MPYGSTLGPIMDAVSDAVLVVDVHGRIVLANRAVTALFGYRPAELVGRPIEVLIPESARDQHVRLRQGYTAAPRARPMGEDLHLSGRRRDGSILPIDVSLAPLHPPDVAPHLARIHPPGSEPLLFTAVVRDLSLTRHGTPTRDQATLDRFRLTIHQASTPMLVLDARLGFEGTIVEVNRAFCDLLGRSEADLLARQAATVFLPEFRPGHAPGRGAPDLGQEPDQGRVEPPDLQREILTAQPPAGGAQWRVRHADGHTVWISLAGVLIRDEGAKPDYVLVHQVLDVTEYRRARDRAQQINDRNRRIATTLQRGLRPTVPSRIGRARIAARYRSADSDELVGGDWYDVFPLPDGRLGLTVGDVAGHGIETTVAMSRLRHAVRVLASGGAGPAAVVTAINQIVHQATPPANDDEAAGEEDVGEEDVGEEADFATMVHAQIDPDGLALIYCRAGHLPLLALTPAGVDPRAATDGAGAPAGPVDGSRVRVLDEEGGPPVGVLPDAEYREHRAGLDPGGMLIGFTDGLIEDRQHSIDHNLARLLAGLRAFPAHVISDLDLLVDAVLRMGPSHPHDDDTAIIALTPNPLRETREPALA